MQKLWGCWRPSTSCRDQRGGSTTKINNYGHEFQLMLRSLAPCVSTALFILLNLHDWLWVGKAANWERNRGAKEKKKTPEESWHVRRKQQGSSRKTAGRKCEVFKEETRGKLKERRRTFCFSSSLSVSSSSLSINVCWRCCVKVMALWSADLLHFQRLISFFSFSAIKHWKHLDSCEGFWLHEV